MSTLALPLGAGKLKTERQSCLAVHPLLAPKRLLQLALVALIVVPIPSDDGPFKPHTFTAAQTKVEQAKFIVSTVAKVNR
jgi:hypothetical protein